jgi:hypothetical protein
LAKRIATILSAALVVATSTSCGKSEDQSLRIRASIERAVPLGRDPTRAIAILDSLRIDHAQYDRSARQIRAIARNVSHNWIVRTDLQITMQFDSTGKLASRVFKPVYTGP